MEPPSSTIRNIDSKYKFCIVTDSGKKRHLLIFFRKLFELNVNVTPSDSVTPAIFTDQKIFQTVQIICVCFSILSDIVKHLHKNHNQELKVPVVVTIVWSWHVSNVVLPRIARLNCPCKSTLRATWSKQPIAWKILSKKRPPRHLLSANGNYNSHCS